MPAEPETAQLVASRFAALPAPFVCVSTTKGLEAAWLRVAGELDILTTPQLEQALSHALAKAYLVVIDMRELTFLGSAGVRVLVAASHRARQTGRRVVLVRGPSNVDQLFGLAGVSADVDIADIDPGETSAQLLTRLSGDTLAA